jgi:hypothetical protein
VSITYGRLGVSTTLILPYSFSNFSAKLDPKPINDLSVTDHYHFSIPMSFLPKSLNFRSSCEATSSSLEDDPFSCSFISTEI